MQKQPIQTRIFLNKLLSSRPMEDALQVLNQSYNFVRNYETAVSEAAEDLTDFFDGDTPEFALVLGSGLGGLAKRIENARKIPTTEIRGFLSPSVEGHAGELVYGTLEGVKVVGVSGRVHFYEVADQPFNEGILRVVLPVHALAEAGVGNYFVTNASGGLNPNYKVGDVMALRSHINLIPNALLGRHHTLNIAQGERSGNRVDRFLPMNGAYDPEYLALLEKAGQAHSDFFHTGVYLGVTGPTYETEGECIAFRDGFKADVVGMSTTPEVIVARSRGMRCVGLSGISNAIAEDGTNATNHAEVQAALNDPVVQARRADIISGFFSLYGGQ
jgi:purine-nucleoside phosphorylase